MGKTSNGNLYAGHDGNVYKDTGSGWQKYGNGSWNEVQKPTQPTTQPTTGQQRSSTSNPNSFGDQPKAQSYNQQRTAGSTGDYSGQQRPASTNDLNQEAQDRQRGAEQNQRFSQDFARSGEFNGGGYQSWGGGRGRSGGGRR